MARVSDASRPEGGTSAPSPLGREGAEGGLSRLMRLAGGEGRSVPFVSSKSTSAFLGGASGVRKSYESVSEVRKSFWNSGSTGADVRGVMGSGVGTSATRGAGSPASRALRAPWTTGSELAEASLAAATLKFPVWSLAVTKLRPLGSDRLESGFGFGLVVAAGGGAARVRVWVSKATLGILVMGGLGAARLVSGAGEDGEDVARGDTGGLLLAFRAASLGECLRLGGIGVPDFWGLVHSGVGGGVIFFSGSSGGSLFLCSTNGAILASTAEVEMMGVGGAVLDSGVGAGAGAGTGEGSGGGSLAGVDRLQVRVVVSLEGLS